MFNFSYAQNFEIRRKMKEKRITLNYVTVIIKIYKSYKQECAEPIVLWESIVLWII